MKIELEIDIGFECTDLLGDCFKFTINNNTVGYCYLNIERESIIEDFSFPIREILNIRQDSFHDYENVFKKFGINLYSK